MPINRWFAAAVAVGALTGCFGPIYNTPERRAAPQDDEGFDQAPQDGEGFGDEDEQAPEGDVEGDQFVLVAAGAPIHTAPNTNAPTFTAWANPGDANPEFPTVYRLVAQKGAWVQIENVPQADDHCYSPLRHARAFKLNFYVPRASLVEVTRAPARVRFPDGTSVSLVPGVTLYESKAPGMRDVYVDGLRFSLPVSNADVGTAYTPEALFKATPDDQVITAETLATRKVTFGGGGEIIPTADVINPVRVTRTHPLAEGDELVTFQSPCARFVARAPAGAVIPSPVLGLLGTMGDEPPGRPAAVSGATVFWRSGQVAGETLQEVSFDAEVEGGAGGLRCFQKALRYIGQTEKNVDPRNYLEVCFRTTDLVE